MLDIESEVQTVSLMPANLSVSQPTELLHCPHPGVIAPYKQMVQELRRRLQRLGIEVDTVDAMQGREKDVVLLSTVRSNAQVC